MDGVRAAAFDRRVVAVHEGGHVIAAQHFGAEAFGMIWFEGGCWRGSADIPGVDEMPPDQRRVIGVAGAAALMTWLNIPAEAFFSNRLGVSASDWKLIGVVPGRSNIVVLRESLAFTLDLLKRERPALIAMSRQIISESKHHARETVQQARLSRSSGRHRREPSQVTLGSAW
jgi:hypothetical protein